jgi:hypothetical protein
MKMGMPEDTAEQLTWWWDRDLEFTPDDPAGSPYDWTDVPTTDDPGNPDLPDVGDPQSLIVDYALEFSSRPAGSATTVLGEIDNSRAVITLFLADWESVRTANYCMIGETRYRIQFSGPHPAIFGSTIVQVYLEAVDES